MATRTKHTTSHFGEPRRCGWYSSRALVLGFGFMPRRETKQAATNPLPRIDSRISVAGAAGPPG